MAERQEGEENIVGRDLDVGLLHHDVGRIQQVRVRQHRALGIARRAGGIDQRGDVFRLYGGGQRVQRRLVWASRLPTPVDLLKGQDVLHLQLFRLALHRDDRFQRRDLAAKLGDLGDLPGVGDDEETRAGVAEIVADLGGGQRAVDGHGDHSEGLRGQIANRPLNAIVLGDQRETLALFEALPGQPAPKPAHPLGQLVVGPIGNLFRLVLLEPDGATRAMCPNGLQKHLIDGAAFHVVTPLPSAKYRFSIYQEIDGAERAERPILRGAEFYFF